MIKEKDKRRRVQRNIPKRVREFVMVSEAEIYSCTAVKYGHPALELLTWDMIDISEWLEFEFYDFVWFWNNQSGDIKPMLGRWLDISHRIGIALLYWILSEKGKVLSQTTFQHLTAEEPRDPDVQEQIRDYHGSLEDALGSEDVVTSLDGYDYFINDYEEGIAKGDPNKE